MTYYRLYFLDAQGRIRRARELHCRDDAEAIGIAGRDLTGGPMELWSFDRLVRRFGVEEEEDGMEVGAEVGAATAAE